MKLPITPKFVFCSKMVPRNWSGLVGNRTWNNLLLLDPFISERIMIMNIYKTCYDAKKVMLQFRKKKKTDDIK